MKIKLENVDYIRNRNRILKNINLLLDKKTYVLVGPNGSGKTTLLSIISGLEWPSSGKSLLIDSEIHYTSHKRNVFGYFFPRLTSWIDAYHPDLSVLEVICTGFYHQLFNYSLPTSEELNIAEELLNKYIPSLSFNERYKSFSVLSTGEKYRTLLLRSIVLKPDILILDEPFDSLDLKGRFEFEKVIYEIYKEIKVLIIVLHRIEEIPPFIENAILLKNGEIFSYGEINSVLNSKNLSEVYEINIEVIKNNNRFYAIFNNRNYL